MIKKKQKKILLSVTAGAVACAIGAGIWFGARSHGKDPVYVFEFMNIGMTDYWGDTQESYGPVSTDNIQTVFLSDTQTITEVLVKEGDTVKKGDLLMTFDTTLSGLDLERKRLEVEKLKLQLEEEKQALGRINSMVPMQTPPEILDPGEGQEPDMGPELREPYQLSKNPVYDGSSVEKAMIIWMRDDTFMDGSVIEAILRQSQDFRVQNLPDATDPTDPGETQTMSMASAVREPLADLLSEPLPEPLPEEPEGESSVPEIEPATRPEPVPGIVRTDGDAQLELRSRPDPEAEILGAVSAGEKVLVYEPVDPLLGWLKIAAESQEALTGWVPADRIDLEPAQPEGGNQEPEPPQNPDSHGESGGTPEGEPGGNSGGNPENPPAGPDTSKPEPPVPPLPDLPTGVNQCYVVIKVTEKNQTFATRTVWQGVLINRNGSFRFFSAAGLPDHSLELSPEDSEMDFPEFDIGSGFTASEIAKMRAEQLEKIKDAEFKIKMAEADYKIKKREMDDGNIHAEFDGAVVSLLPEADARKQKKPFLKVSGGGGFFVEGSISELDRETLQIGQEVTVNDWNSGEMYPGEVVSVGDFPVSSGYRGAGNPNCSYYPFKAFVDGSANLQAGSYVNIQYSAGGTEHGIYLENPFIRKEAGKSYVYVLGENDRLEKREVVTGKALWGSYTEVLSGVTVDDLIAFPYGKNVKPGVKAQLGDMQDLYG